MRYLLDTNALLWSLMAPSRLGEDCRQRLAETEEIYVSVLSLCEIAIKVQAGKIKIDGSMTEHIEQHQFQLLAFEPAHMRFFGYLPREHKDPFDRMLAAQAVSEDLQLITSDSVLLKFMPEAINAGR